MPDNNGVQYTNPPQSRNEELLEDIITGTPYTAPPQSEIEEILVSIIDETPYHKAPQSRNADLLLQVKEKIEEGGGGSPITLKATFNNTTPANAHGEIVLLSTSSTYNGSYDIMWGDDSGVMSNYTKIGSINIDVTNNKNMGSIKMREFNAIPKYATRICAVKNNEIVTSFNIPSSKLWASGNYGEHLYSVGVWSDPHRQYDTAEQDIITCLQYNAQRESVIANVVAGDLTGKGTVSHLNAWKTTRDAYRGNTPVYSCVGNHEAYDASAVMYSEKSKIREYLDSDWTSGSSTTAYFIKTIGNDKYIFLSIFEDTYQGKNNTMFTAAELEWLEEKLETYRNQRVFLFAHVPPHWETDGIKYSGFGNGNGAYKYDIWGNPYVTDRPLEDRIAFLNLIDHYKNVVWFSGHSHIKYEYEKLWDALNVKQYKGGARFVHVSSLTVPRDIIDGSVSSDIYAESEGSVMDVYTNCIRIRSRNYVGEKFYGIGEYLIDTTPVNIPSKSRTLVSISATKTKTQYNTDEYGTFSTDDITVTATWSDNTTSTVPNADVVFDTQYVDIATAGTYSIGVSYTYDGVTETTSVQVTSTATASTPTIILDASFVGQLPSADSALDATTINEGIANATQHTVDALVPTEGYNKQLYYRLIGVTGVSGSELTGFESGVKSDPTSGSYIHRVPNYSMVQTSWTAMAYSGNPLVANEEAPYLYAKFKASASSTATFPVTVNVRVQIGYK